MHKPNQDRTPADLAWVVELLHEERPLASPLELDRIKLRARSQSLRGGRSRRKGSLLKSRLAITSILVLGLFTSGTGATLALSGASGSAAKTEYPVVTTPTTTPTIAPTTGSGPGPEVLGTTETSGPARPAGKSGKPAPVTAPAQATRQVAAVQGKRSLPFTGLAAIPILLAGLGMLGGGLLLHRSARRSHG
jgi:hypothetical protein